MTEENGQEETDKVNVELINLGTVNKNKVRICKGLKSVDLFFSYKTLVAVDNIVSVNKWSKTTGKLLNELQPHKEARVSHEYVLRKAQERIKAVLY